MLLMLIPQSARPSVWSVRSFQDDYWRFCTKSGRGKSLNVESTRAGSCLFTALCGLSFSVYAVGSRHECYEGDFSYATEHAPEAPCYLCKEEASQPKIWSSWLDLKAMMACASASCFVDNTTHSTQFPYFWRTTPSLRKNRYKSWAR